MSLTCPSIECKCKDHGDDIAPFVAIAGTSGCFLGGFIGTAVGCEVSKNAVPYLVAGSAIGAAIPLMPIIAYKICTTHCKIKKREAVIVRDPTIRLQPVLPSKQETIVTWQPSATGTTLATGASCSLEQQTSSLYTVD